MTEGSAVPYARRSYLTLFQAATGLSGVRVQYSPIFDFDEALGDNGDIECIYWGDATSQTDLRGMRATAHTKYREEATAELTVMVAARDAYKTFSDIESRAANLLGEVIKVIQTSPGLASPGSHLHGIACWVEGYQLTAGRAASAGTPVYAASYLITVHIQANVEQ
jgi:hypothetical protein